MYLLSFAAPYCAMLHPTELQCTLLSYSILWATLHRTELSVTFLGFPATSELGCILLSYAAACTLRSKDAPYWSALHPAERHCTFWATLYPFWAKLTISVIDENLGQGVIAGVNNSSNRLLPSNNDTGDNLSPESFTPVNNLMPVSLNFCKNLKQPQWDTEGSGGKRFKQKTWSWKFLVSHSL